MTASPSVRRADVDDASEIGRLLHDFNREFDEPTPPAEAIAERLVELMGGAGMAVLLCGDGPDGLAVLRFRPAIWSQGLECYLAELYVVPALRGQGIGRALMEAAIDFARQKGADYMDVSTSEDDVAARALYEKMGFVDRERGGEGPLLCFYEREL